MAASAVAITGAGQLEPVASFSLLDDDTLSLSLISGRLTWTRVIGVEETSDRVQVTVRSFQFPLLGGSALGIPVELQVDLARPLGEREVFDGYRQVRRDD